MTEHKSSAWLLNTGWTGQSVAKGGKRCPLKYTRAILDAIHAGTLKNAEFETYPTFGLPVPKAVPGVPSEILNPAKNWVDGPKDFQREVTGLAQKFLENFEKYSAGCTKEVIAAGPAL
ncbi:unnamed protein product [Ambrosiozyma monospora]|uniref:Unnamed protein product n=1 Tax=Ambrosiozyma monospora TaxID=43982 RepID=A0ACB5TE17_AMBMO|nr:unnamed protein product [Ambrosiozyma monospora]